MSERTEDPHATGRLLRAGQLAWASLGVAGGLVVLGLLASQLSLVIIPLVLALFPATLLVPVCARLRRWGWPPALAALATLLGGILVLGAVLAVMVSLVIAELPELRASASDGVEEIERFLRDDPLGVGINGIGDALELLREQLGEAEGVGDQAIDAAAMVFGAVAGSLLMLVVLFFYLKDGPRLVGSAVGLFAVERQARVRARLSTAWDTLSGYFQGQLVVAFVDAVGIGVGLLVLGVPLALPLAVLVFFGGLFPIVGAVVTGTLAVLVALAHGGLVTAGLVVGLVLLVQQLESNVLQPFILGNAVSLHPLVILLAVTAGGLTFGVLGAFLGVPVAAIAARLLDGSAPEPG
ncbi:MAG: AI-2E family transporter [Nitriliruptoraceae bacterium]|nr:AI-2E family transporter [Nitriliruptoraceae bacterium]